VNLLRAGRSLSDGTAVQDGFLNSILFKKYKTVLYFVFSEYSLEMLLEYFIIRKMLLKSSVWKYFTE